MPSAFASPVRATAQPSLFDRTITGLPFNARANARSQLQ
jgi:hypothetical protein